MAAAVIAAGLQQALYREADRPATQGFTLSPMFTCLLFRVLTWSRVGATNCIAVFAVGAACGCFRFVYLASKR